MKKKSTLLFCLLAINLSILSFNVESQVLNINFTEQDITIDGILNEQIWNTAGKLNDFKQYKPKFGEAVSLHTGLKSVYNNRMIYFSFECEDPEINKLSASAERDGAIGNDDAIVFLLDTFNDKSNAYIFAVNSLGTQFDAKITENGKSWDLKWNRNWKAVCKINKTGWIAEIGIPFNEIAFDKETKTMGFNAARNIPRNHEEAFLILNQSSRWNISKLGQINNLDLSKVDLKNYKKNLETHFNTLKKIKISYLKSDKYILKENLFYKDVDNLSNYEKDRCFLDLYLPKDLNNFPIMIWFHGGSLKKGSKDEEFTRDMAKHFAHRGLAVAVVNYRLSPNIKYPSYIDDAAASIAWIINNIKDYNGNPNAVFVAGHSAGGYLAYILGMDRKYLKAVNVKIDQITGLIPISGQTFTHYTIREERGIPNPEITPIIDEASPCFHVQKSGPPIFAICGDKDPQDRIKENQYFHALLKKVGYTNIEYFEPKDRTHWELITKIPTIDDPVSEAILKFVSRYSQLNK